MQYIFLALIMAGVLATLRNWRTGLYWIILIAALQDPVRKMTPGVTSLFVLSTIPVWLAVFLNIWSREKFAISLFRRIFPRLRVFYLVFLCTLIPGAAVMLSFGLDTAGAVILGAFSYIGPMIGVIVGFVYLKDQQTIIRLLSFYCLVTAVMLVGTPLEYLNVFPGLNALGTAALDMQWIKYVSFGVTIYMKAGFYRSPDIMGWHAATMTMLSILLFLQGRSLLFPRWLCLAFAVWGAFCIVLSGRYKMIATTIVWGVIFSLLLFHAKKGGKILALAMIACIAIVGMNALSKKIGLDEGFLVYASSPLSYSTERLEKHGVGSVFVTFQQSGFWGRGLGSATQGAEHGGRVVKGWQEGGTSKLIAELGVPGTVAFAILILFLLKSILLVIRLSANTYDMVYWNYGLISFFLANGASFVVSYQVFGDPFILILLSFLLGVALSAPRLLYFGQQGQFSNPSPSIQTSGGQQGISPQVSPHTHGR